MSFMPRLASFMMPLKRFQSREKGLADLMPWATLMDDGVVIQKDGSLLSGWFFRGPDVASSTPRERDLIAARINRALAQLGDGWAFWFEAVRMPAASYPPCSAMHFPDQITALMDEERRSQFLAAGAHYETEQALIVMYTPPERHIGWIASRVVTGDGEERAPVSDQQIAAFKRGCSSIEDVLADDLSLRRMGGFDYTDARGKRHHQDELVNFLHFCVVGEEGGINIPPCAMHLDGLIGGQELWTGLTPRLGSKFISCIAIEGFPAESYSFILDLLVDQPFAYRVSSRFIPLSQPSAKKEIERHRRSWSQITRGFVTQILRTSGGWVNEDAALMASQTEAALSDASSGLVVFGYYTAVVVLMGESRAELEAQARHLAREIGRLGFAARTESVNTVEAWLGTLPGHVRPNIRRPVIHSLNYANLVPASGRATGLEYNPSPLFPPHSPALLYAATDGATPFRINLHVSDVGHSLIFGPTGSGKSVLLANLASAFRRYHDARVTVFDKGNSIFALAKAIERTGRAEEAAHYELAGDTSPGLCPLAFLDKPGDIAWAEDWLATCFELQTGKQPSPQQKSAIHRAIELMRQTSRTESRSLTDFLTTVQDDDIRAGLRAYTIDGPLGELLDARHDSLGSSLFTVFELDKLLTLRDANILPVLLYLFRRFEQSLTGTPAMLILDEAWVMLGHPVFREKLREWLKTLRKMNCAVVMATQSLSDARRSGLLDVLLESCPTRFFLPNAEAHQRGAGDVLGPYEIYTAFGLNDAEIGIIATAAPKRDIYYTSPGGKRLFQLLLGPVTLAFTAASSMESVTAIRGYDAQYREAWPFQWLESKGIRYEPYLPRAA